MSLAQILNLLPIIQQIIVFVEGLFPNAKAGADKLNAAIGMITQIVPEVAGEVGSLKNVVNASVTAMNIAGALGGGTAKVTDTTVG